ncbi:hypothetical protein LFYK43_22440 [Ligilactobacillus salitolerans]|uniref:Uncharacterized protein n=1 Tax=Ligilactobacillus salitolerans TaxID=1808352 RepID=A0A401IWA3_9LACO|nr:hypothetical protein LFYK43_22440 [Ligilactobacillus salitolerans]
MDTSQAEASHIQLTKMWGYIAQSNLQMNKMWRYISQSNLQSKNFSTRERLINSDK